MRDFTIGCLVLFAMAGTAFSEAKEPPKKLAVDLGGGVKLDLVLIPAGSFTMGDDRFTPTHKVTITKPLYLGKYEVTQKQWEAVMGSNPSNFKSPKNPVEQVSWDDCQAFLDKLNTKAGGKGYKFVLPTEAQWEYACRAGSTGKFCFGDDEKQLGEYAWYTANSGDKTHPVGGKKPNTFGLHDMHGNVWEWCQDWCGAYGAEAVRDPSGPTTGLGRRNRGGGGSDDGGLCLSAYRSCDEPGARSLILGLRVARVPAAGAASPASGAEPIAGPSPEQPTAPQEQAAQQPAVITNSIGMELVLIPAGSFTMGDDSPEPAHKVTITKPFYLGKYEVTQEQWEAVMGSNPSNFKGPKNPVEQVNWDDCQAFLDRLNTRAGGKGYKFVLPTEAQWEYACRAGSTGKFCFGDDEKQLGEYAWYRENSESKTHPVGEKKPNAWGLYDMHGNVWEWCQDWHGGCGAEAVRDPSGPTTGLDRVNRGGSWHFVGWRCQSGCRSFIPPELRYIILGLRVARVPAD